MTANIMFVVEDGIAAFSDGAAYDETGTVRQIHDKQVIRADIETVITASGSGSGLALLQLAMNADAPADFDAVTDHMPRWLREVHALMMAAHPDRGETGNWCMLLLGGWSERAGAWKAFFICTLPSALYGDLTDPFVLVPITGYGKPSASAEALERVGLPEGLSKIPEGLDAHEFGLRMMMAQRHTKQPEIHGPGSIGGYCVGGFIQHTHLRRGRAETRIVYRWPDEVGRPMDPPSDPAFGFSRGDALPSALDGREGAA